MSFGSDGQYHPVGFCQLHGLFDHVGVAGGTTPCPECGRDARVFDRRDKAVLLRAHSLVDSAATLEAVVDMRDLLERVQRGEIGPDAAANEARKINGQFGRVVAQALRIDAWAVPALISMLSLYYRLKEDYSGTAQIGNLVKLIDRQREPLEQLRAALGISSGPVATPPTEAA